MLTRSVFVQFGPQSVKQRCSASIDLYASLDIVDRRIGEFALLFEIVNQLDLLKIAFVGHMDATAEEANNADGTIDNSSEFDEDVLDSLLVGLGRFSPSFAQRCLWRAVRAMQVSIGLWQETASCFLPLQSFSDITDGSALIIAAPTSEDAPLDPDVIDEELTQQVIDDAFDVCPSNVLDFVLALMRSPHTDRLDDVGVQLLIRDQFESPKDFCDSIWRWPFLCLRDRAMNLVSSVDGGDAAVSQLPEELPKGTCVQYPRKLPPQRAPIPVYLSQVVNNVGMPKADVDADAEFTILYEKGGRLTIKGLLGAAGREGSEGVDEASSQIRVVRASDVLGFIKARFPFVDHGDGKGCERVLASAYQRPHSSQSDATGVNALGERPRAPIDASRAVSETGNRRQPQFPFLTEDEFKILISKILAM